MREVAAQLVVEKLQPAEHDPRKLALQLEEVLLLDRLVSRLYVPHHEQGVFVVQPLSKRLV